MKLRNNFKLLLTDIRGKYSLNNKLLTLFSILNLLSGKNITPRVTFNEYACIPLCRPDTHNEKKKKESKRERKIRLCSLDCKYILDDAHLVFFYVKARKNKSVCIVSWKVLEVYIIHTYKSYPFAKEANTQNPETKNIHRTYTKK